MAVRLIRPVRHQDHRGWFSETWSAAKAADLGLPSVFVQDNQSFSRLAGTVRGLHFQCPPSAQAKLECCLSGRILDCAVDLRHGSPTWGHSLSVELTDQGEQLFVPEGFAHGFMTLTDDTLVSYKVSAPYDPSTEAGVAWDDPALAIDWPRRRSEVVISPRDAVLPPLSAVQARFDYDGVPMRLIET
jgi:dTDP-4-dehydrorhamnose 3,5-epimerase